MNRILTVVASAVCIIYAQGACAQRVSGFQVDEDLETATVQSTAESLFKSGRFEDAYYMYVNELAPIGDKYAQYMLGFMTYNGLGVEEDRIRASAWYRLAAERNAPGFVAIREQMLGELNESDLQRSDEAYLELRKKYSDIAVRMRLVRRDFEMASEIPTGSRIGSTSSSVTVIQFGNGGRTGSSKSHDSYTRSIRLRMQEHLDHITAALRIPPVDGNLTERQLQELEEKVSVYLAQISDR